MIPIALHHLEIERFCAALSAMSVGAFIRTAAHQRQVRGINGLSPGTVTADISQRSAIEPERTLSVDPTRQPKLLSSH